jgi:WD40 repeat protein
MELPTNTSHNSLVTGLAYSADGKELTVTSVDGVTVWDVTGKRPKEKKAGAAKQKDDDKTAVKAYDELEGRPEKLAAFVALPGHKVRVAAGEDGTVTAWDAAGTKLASWKFAGPVGGLALSADGKRLATANPNGTAYVLRVGK